jgi:Ser/Thr protein kinase RdoA (MazF antagonist)
MVVGKFYRPGRWSKAAILDEHDFLFELAEEEIPVATPIRLDGRETIGQVDGIYYSFFERVGGRIPEEPSDDQLRVFGRLVARIHNIGARKKAKERLKLSVETYGENNLNYLIESDAIDPQAKDNYIACAQALFQRIQPLFAELPVHRIHGDCHLNNLLMTSAGPTFLDFDDMCIGPAIQDLWLLAPSSDAEGKRQRDILVEAYSQLRDFSPSWMRLVEPLRALRYIHYVTWIARRYEDPAFKRIFPHFGSLQYWQKEANDLREQIARVDHEVL